MSHKCSRDCYWSTPSARCLPGTAFAMVINRAPIVQQIWTVYSLPIFLRKKTRENVGEQSEREAHASSYASTFSRFLVLKNREAVNSLQRANSMPPKICTL